MPKYLINANIYGEFEKVLDCPNRADALLEANEMAHLYTDIEYNIEELHEDDGDF